MTMWKSLSLKLLHTLCVCVIFEYICLNIHFCELQNVLKMFYLFFWLSTPQKHENLYQFVFTSCFKKNGPIRTFLLKQLMLIVDLSTPCCGYKYCTCGCHIFSMHSSSETVVRWVVSKRCFHMNFKCYNVLIDKTTEVGLVWDFLFKLLSSLQTAEVKLII